MDVLVLNGYILNQTAPSMFTKRDEISALLNDDSEAQLSYRKRFNLG